MRCPAVSQCDA